MSDMFGEEDMPGMNDDRDGGVVQVPFLTPQKNPEIDLYWSLIEDFNALYFDLHRRTELGVREAMEGIYEKLVVMGGYRGISSLSVPKLRLCCGRGRSEISDGVGLGDAVKWFLEKIGIRRQCEGCKRRQAWLNKFRNPFTRRHNDTPKQGNGNNPIGPAL